MSTPTPTPTPEEPEVATILIRAEAVILQAEDGIELASFDYFAASTPPIVDALNEAFGVEAEGEKIDGGVHPSWLEYDWDGFVVRTYDATGQYPDVTSFSVYTLTAESHGIDIETIGGLQVGSTAKDAAAGSFVNRVDTGGTQDVHFYSVDKVDVELDYDPGYDDTFLSVSLWGGTPKKPIYRVQAPSANFGA